MMGECQFVAGVEVTFFHPDHPINSYRPTLQMNRLDLVNNGKMCFGSLWATAGRCRRALRC